MTRKEIVLVLLERLIRERHKEFVGFAFRLTGNMSVAEEITQEGYRKALLNWHTYDRQFAFSSWCGTIIRNLHIDRCRNKATHSLSLDRTVLWKDGHWQSLAVLLPDKEPPALDLMLREEERQAACKAYASLGPMHKSIVRLVAKDGLTYRDVAKKLSLRVGTVRSRLYRARRIARSQYP